MHLSKALIRIHLCMALMAIFVSGCFQPETFRFYDDGTGEEKAMVKNLITQFIIEKGFGHFISYVPGKPNASLEAIVKGNIDVAFVANLDKDVIGQDKNLVVAGDYVVRTELKEIAPDVLEALSKITFSDDVITECLTWRDDHQDADLDDVVLYFMLNYQSTWKKWIKDDTYFYAREGMSQQIEKSRFKDEL